MVFKYFTFVFGLLAVPLSLGSAVADFCANPGADGPATPISGVINTYFAAASSSSIPVGGTSVLVNSSVGAINTILPGDLILLIQMQDATIDYSNSNAYGDGVSEGALRLSTDATQDPARGYTAINSAGRYEFVRATNVVPVSGGTLTFMGAGPGSGAQFAYTNAAATPTHGQRRFQVIRVPQYTNVLVNAGLSVYRWNGSAGGVLIMDVLGDVDMNGQTVDLSAYGFRGGGMVQEQGPANGVIETDHVHNANGSMGMKGEGIAGTPRFVYERYAAPPDGLIINYGIQGYPGGDKARGAPGNAGGGGNDSNPGTNDTARPARS